MTTRCENYFILTGGPGAGKTAVIEALGRAGYVVSEEAGRRIIRDQMRITGKAVPWRDRALYAELMLSWELRAYAEFSERRGNVFFDRGLPDIVGYLRLEGLPVPDHVLQATRLLRYNRRVFLFPPWPEIFVQDGERRQTPEVAERTYRSMRETYAELGYMPVEVPKAPVAERVRFIVDAIVAPT